MKDRLMRGWSFGRILYLLLGIYVIIATAMEGHWFGIGIGAYFAAMGLFRFGCAAGSCYKANSFADPKQENGNEIHFGEVK